MAMLPFPGSGTICRFIVCGEFTIYTQRGGLGRAANGPPQCKEKFSEVCGD